MLTANQFNSVRNMPALSKRAMLARFEEAPVSAKLIARNTLDYVDALGLRRIRLHSTDILTIAPDGAFAIDTGGWNTVTTRARLNDSLPRGWRVYTERGRIHLSRRDATPLPFMQSVSVSANDVARPDTEMSGLERDRKALDAYMRAWKKRGLPMPEESGGDPWVIDDGRKIDDGCMRDWIESRYVFLRLFKMAHMYAGASEYGVALYAQSAWRRGLDRMDLSRIRRYCRACLGYAA